MNKIEKLIKEFCLDGVEWKKLGEVCEIKRGRVISKQYLEIHQGEYPVYSSQTRDNGKIGSINTYDFDGEYVTWTTDGAYAGTIFYRSGKFSITNICGLIFPKDKNILNLKFVFYWLQITTKKYVKDGSGNPKLMSNVMGNITIPIPSIETQEKIVKILDGYTKYITELQEKLKIELQSRNKQYNYYRDMLLSEDYLNKISNKIFMQSDNVIHKTKLIEIAKLSRGKRLVRSELHKNGQYPVFQNSLTPLGYYNNKNFDGGKTCIITAGAAGEVFYQDRDFWAADDVFVITTDDILNKYLYYFLLNKQNLIKSKVRKASVPRLSRDDIEKIEVLLPPIEIQNKIVKILDRFQELLSDTKGLLPLEIEQRRKQYEYYREKLLTFDSKCGSLPACLPACLPYNKY